ncbi:PREDICTED: T-kininogen 2-like [Gavialis gangeticus]|uniref:T-kininogen 2-like n=1 Tax=Gavialis gangeticus TaxID=94835 RepID=UPI00092F03E0|nr:PREDICTED: T-kininogen 2-like [Gavialis gangeticus]
MKFFIVLLLCCSSFSSKASPLPAEDVDCDHPEVFEAVDIALRKYNDDKVDGNQFALYMVMDAQRTAGPGAQFFVKYQIRESTCAIGEGKPWQDCDYRESVEAETGECTAEVYIDKAQKISNVSQECKIISAAGRVTLSHAPCLGCYHPIPGNSLDLLPILRYAIRIFNKESQKSFLYEVGEIITATRQVVAGWNYAVEYTVKETNCSKEQFQDLSPKCKPIFGGHVGHCVAKAFVDLSNTLVDVTQQCKFPVEETVPPPQICPGCPKRIPNDSPELKEILKASMEKYNSESNDDFYYKVERVLHTTVQVVAGKNYEIEFLIGKTNCSKSEVEKLNEDCEVVIPKISLQCIANIYVVPWKQKIIPQVNCSEVIPSILARRPPGFTPFRSLMLHEIYPLTPSLQTAEEGTDPDKGPREDLRPGLENEDGQGDGCDRRVGHGHGHGHRFKHRPGHGKGRGRGHGIGRGHKKHQKKDKHKDSKDKSSEESEEKVPCQRESQSPSIDRTSENSQFPTTPGVVQFPTTPGLMQSDALTTPGVMVGPRNDASTPDIPEEPISPGTPEIAPDISLFDELPDLPEPPVPKCPGKPWKSIMQLTNPSEKTKLFTNEDLLPHPFENLNPASEKPSPINTDMDDFDLVDALPL